MPHDPAHSPAALTGLAAWLALVLTAAPAAAAPSTAQGQISVAQVQEMLERAPANPAAQQVLTAYLAGIGETADATLGTSGASCRKPMSLSAADVSQAVRAAGGASAATVAATPIIVRDMLARAGCGRP